MNPLIVFHLLYSLCNSVSSFTSPTQCMIQNSFQSGFVSKGDFTIGGIFPLHYIQEMPDLNNTYRPPAVKCSGWVSFVCFGKSTKSIFYAILCFNSLLQNKSIYFAKFYSWRLMMIIVIHYCNYSETAMFISNCTAALIQEPSAGHRRWGLRSRRLTWVRSCCLITRWATQSLIPVDIHWLARELLWLYWMDWTKQTLPCAVGALHSSLSSASLVLLCPLCCQEYCSYSKYPW